jgi:hypothetical protein
MARKDLPSPSIELLQTLIHLEQTSIPLDDFASALIELALVDRFTGKEIQKAFTDSSKSDHGLHGVDHTVRVVFWVLYLVEISNRLGYPIREEEKLAAVLAALVHDLSRTDDMPGGKHGEIASREYGQYLQEQLSPAMLVRCVSAVKWHGYSQEPKGSDPVWMLLKDADALDRARFAAPGTIFGCNPARLRLPVLKEITPVLDGCMKISMQLPALITLNRLENLVFRTLTDGFVRQLITGTFNGDESIQQSALLISDQYYAAV